MPLYCGHHWDPHNCQDFMDGFATIGTQEIILFEGCPYLRGVHSERLDLTVITYLVL